MQTIQQAANDIAKQIAKRLSTVIGAIILLFAAFFISWNSYFKVESGVSAVSKQLSHFVELGDTFQLKTQLLSLVDSQIVDHFALFEAGGLQIATDEGETLAFLNFVGLPNRFMTFSFSSGSFEILRKFKIQLQSGSNCTLVVSKKIHMEFFVLLFVALILIFSSTYLILRKLIKNFAEDLTNPITTLSEALSKTNNFNELNENKLVADQLKYQEIMFSYESFVNLIERLRSEQDLRINLEKTATFNRVAAQVAHDIRSPISALNMVAKSIPEISGDLRSLLHAATRRINDIANDLLSKSKDVPSSAVNASVQFANKPKEIVPVAMIIENIFNEKCVQFGNRQLVTFSLETKQIQDALVAININEFSRVLSNLLNNAFESIHSDTGAIIVSGTKDEKSILLKIKDTGCGISDGVLAKLGKERISLGNLKTEGGSGIGVLTARQAIEGWGGKIEFSSQLGRGTEVNIMLPRVFAPDHLVNRLTFGQFDRFVTVDDDPTIHKTWRERLSLANQSEVKHIILNSGYEFKSWVKEHGQSNAVFLVDFELKGEAQSGLDLIQELNLQHSSFLVTSRFDEQSVIDEAEKLKVKIIPKINISTVQFDVHPATFSVDNIQPPI